MEEIQSEICSFSATDLESKPKEKKVTVLLNSIGDDGLELFNSYTFPLVDEKKLECILKKFEDHCLLKCRSNDTSCISQYRQLFDNFVTELRKAIKTTQYDDS